MILNKKEKPRKPQREAWDGVGSETIKYMKITSQQALCRGRHNSSAATAKESSQIDEVREPSAAAGI